MAIALELSSHQGEGETSGSGNELRVKFRCFPWVRVAVAVRGNFQERQNARNLRKIRVMALGHTSDCTRQGSREVPALNFDNVRFRFLLSPWRLGRDVRVGVSRGRGRVGVGSSPGPGGLGRRSNTNRPGGAHGPFREYLASNRPENWN